MQTPPLPEQTENPPALRPREARSATIAGVLLWVVPTRHAEIRRLDWRAAWLKDRLIEVTAAKAKTASRRLVPIILLAHAPLG